MISVLIPVYNTSITLLAKELSSQLAAADFPGEILLVDDQSDDACRLENRQVKDLPFISYFELDENIGRFRIRRLLASKASGTWLLFLDGDSQIIHPTFLQDYYRALKDGYGVIVGGRVYPSRRPDDCTKVLHWEYGRKRENVLNKNRGFLSNNFLVRKDVFLTLEDNNSWQGYGHEDTWMGIQLEKKQIAVQYISNPVLHAVLDSTEVFLQKHLQALDNLMLLSEMYGQETVRSHVTLFRAFLWQRRLGLSSLILSLYRILRRSMYRNLISCHPSLRLFDFYRLGSFILVSRRIHSKTAS